MNTHFAQLIYRRKTVLSLAVGLPALLVALPLICAGQRNAPRGAAPRGGGAVHSAPARAVVVDRSSHGSIRHAETHVVERPAEIRREPERRVEVAPRHEVVVHRDVEADIHRERFWHGFSYHRHWGVLPVGCVALSIGGLPYYYNNGIYYQPDNGGYQEVYPPVGAAVPQPPDGAIEVDAGGQVYYYAGGAFYVQQPDGTFVIAPTPIGVVVPELPPGAVQVSVGGRVAYQFNGIYYEPVFVNGVTQYETFVP